MKTAVVDRIEGDKVILIFKDRIIIKNLSAFNEPVSEGDVVNLETLKVESKLTEEKRKNVRSLLNKVFK